MQSSEAINVQTQWSLKSQKKKILVIDDSAEILEPTIAILEMSDYDCFAARSGIEALAILAENNPLNLILLDIKMKGMSGPEFLTELEKVNPKIVENVPIIFLTALDKVPTSKAAGFIKKPFNIDEFLKAVNQFIEIETDHSCLKH